jgi:hypothetical protein
MMGRNLDPDELAARYPDGSDERRVRMQKRLDELKTMGAGDAECAECLGMNIPSIVICKKCIADTPAFVELVGRLMQRADQAPNAEVSRDDEATEETDAGATSARPTC